MAFLQEVKSEKSEKSQATDRAITALLLPIDPLGITLLLPIDPVGMTLRRSGYAAL